MNKHTAATFSYDVMISRLVNINKNLRRYFYVELIIGVLFCIIPFESLAATLLQILLFTALGVFNIWLLHKEYKPENEKIVYATVVVGAAQFVVVLLVLLLVQSFFNYISFTTAFAGSGAFFLPLLVHHAWIMFMDIPAETLSPWYLPESETPQSGAASLPMLVQLEIKREPGQQARNTYPITVSAKLKLGKVFEKLVLETKQAGSNKVISIKDAQEQPYGWQFFEIKWLGFYKRFLDPSLSLLANKLKANARIIIVRAAIEH